MHWASRGIRRHFVGRGEVVGTCESQGSIRDAEQLEEVVGYRHDHGHYPARLGVALPALPALPAVPALPGVPNVPGGHSLRLK